MDSNATSISIWGQKDALCVILLLSCLYILYFYKLFSLACLFSERVAVTYAFTLLFLSYISSRFDRSHCHISCHPMRPFLCSMLAKPRIHTWYQAQMSNYITVPQTPMSNKFQTCSTLTQDERATEGVWLNSSISIRATTKAKIWRVSQALPSPFLPCVSLMLTLVLP